MVRMMFSSMCATLAVAYRDFLVVSSDGQAVRRAEALTEEGVAAIRPQTKKKKQQKQVRQHGSPTSTALPPVPWYM